VVVAEAEVSPVLRHIYPGEGEHLVSEGEVDSQGEGRIRILGAVGAEVGVEVLTPTTDSTVTVVIGAISDGRGFQWCTVHSCVLNSFVICNISKIITYCN
jgi:hypothetical protein